MPRERIEELDMRFLLGLILGAFILGVSIYIHDANVGVGERNMVNWDVVSENWQAAKTRVQREWAQLSARI
jgi:hypothetical protein